MKSSSLRAARFLRTSALGVSIAMAAIAAPAFAQNTTADAPADTATDDSDNTPIIVTAQGRSQLLSDVPVAISAVSAETLQNSGANDIRQLNQVAPSLLVSSTGSEANGSARIRGIGTVGDNPGLESSVPVFIDGVYRSRSGIGLNELGEIDRIEVQRGPQGTLGGRNSSAGLISIYSKKPSFEFGATGEVTYGNYDYWRLGGSVTGPIGETLAARLDGVWVKRDGFYERHGEQRSRHQQPRPLFPARPVAVRADRRAVGPADRRLYLARRGMLRGDLCRPRRSIPMIGNPEHPQRPNAHADAVRRTTSSACSPTSASRLGAFNQGYSRDISVSPGRSFAGKTKDYGFSGQIDCDFGGATLTSITALPRIPVERGRRRSIMARSTSSIARTMHGRLSPVPHLHAGTAPAGRSVRRQARLARRRLLRQRKADACATICASATTMAASPRAASSPARTAVTGSIRRPARRASFPGVGPAAIARGARTGASATDIVAALDGARRNRAIVGSINDVYRQNDQELGAVHAQYLPHHRQARFHLRPPLHQRQEEVLARPSPMTTPPARRSRTCCSTI